MDLSTYSVGSLLRTAYSLTHQMEKSDDLLARADLRAQRDLISEEIERRAQQPFGS